MLCEQVGEMQGSQAKNIHLKPMTKQTQLDNKRYHSSYFSQKAREIWTD